MSSASKRYFFSCLDFETLTINNLVVKKIEKGKLKQFFTPVVAADNVVLNTERRFIQTLWLLLNTDELV